MIRVKGDQNLLEKAVSYLQGVTTFENPGHIWRCVEFNKTTKTAKFLCIIQSHDHDFYIHQEWKGQL